MVAHISLLQAIEVRLPLSPNSSNSNKIMPMLKRYIDAPREVRMRVAKALGITDAAVHLALNYERHGGKSREARAMVLASGEAVIMNYLPQCETIHDAKGKMTQTFLNGLVLIVDKETGRFALYDEDKQVEGEEIHQGRVTTIPELYKLQAYVEDLREA